ncbi:hypothetical protein H1R20_g2185, partial [Candolleomyces eurysporus]
MLAPFAKKPINLTIKGITTDEHDLSADLLRTVTLPHLQLFGISDGLELRIKKRGAAPNGGGELQFLCPIVKQVKTLNFVDPGKIKRIRGIAHAVRVNPQFSNRMIEASRSVLNRYIPDIYLYSDVYKGEESGKSVPHFASVSAAVCSYGNALQVSRFLRDTKDFFATSFKIVPADPTDPECKQLLYSCYGTGYINANRTLA